MLDHAARCTPPGLPPHCLLDKVSSVMRLHRNLSTDRRLVENICVVVLHIP